jgi:hypothetical protein
MKDRANIYRLFTSIIAVAFGFTVFVPEVLAKDKTVQQPVVNTTLQRPIEDFVKSQGVSCHI